MGGARGGGMPRREKRRDPLAFSADKKLLAANLRAAPMEGLSLIDVSGEAWLASCSVLFFRS